jgi:uncharacterized membrane protein YphA (DoxX/SURF4 family)
MMESWKIYLAPLGRLLMSSLFIVSGYTKLFVSGPGGTAHYSPVCAYHCQNWPHGWLLSSS